MEQSILDHEMLFEGCDGKNSWSQSSNAPAKSAEPNFLCIGPPDIDDLLVSYKQKGYTMELIGKDKIESHDVFHLKMRDPKRGKDVMDYFLDAETYLLLKSTYQNNQRSISGTETVCHEDLFSDYRKIDGIMVAFTTDQRWWIAGKEPKEKKPELKATPEQGHQKQIVDEIKFNLPLRDSLFVMPKPSAAPSATNAAKH